MAQNTEQSPLGTAAHVRAACNEAMQTGQATLAQGKHYQNISDVRNVVSRVKRQHSGLVLRVHEEDGTATITAYRQYGRVHEIDEVVKRLRQAALDGNAMLFDKSVNALRDVAFPQADDDALV